MATPRKAWFKVSDSILYEGWNNDQIAIMIRLCAHLNTRWAREGRTTEEAVKTRLGPSELNAISGRSRLDVSRKLLGSLAEVTTMSVTYYGKVTEIEWPKYAEVQGLTPSEYPRVTRELPPTHTQTQTQTHTQQKDKAPAPRARRSSAPKIDPRVVEIWPAIQAAFAKHGRTLGEGIGADRSKLIAKRLDEGATSEHLIQAVHGYVAKHKGLEERDGFDPRQYFTPQTIFKADGFSDRVDFGSGPIDTVSNISRIMARVNR